MTKRDEIRAASVGRLKWLREEIEEARLNDPIPTLKEPPPAVDPADEQPGYLQFPRGLGEDARLSLLTDFEVRLLTHALLASYYLDPADIEGFEEKEAELSEARCARKLKEFTDARPQDPAAAEKKARKCATDAFRRRCYLLDARYMTDQAIERGTGHPREHSMILKAIVHLAQLGLVRWRWALVRRRGERPHRLRFFIVYDHIDPDRCKEPAKPYWWEKLKNESLARGTGWQRWLHEETLLEGHG